MISPRTTRKRFLTGAGAALIGAVSGRSVRAQSTTTSHHGKGARASKIQRWDVITLGNLSRNRYWGESDATGVRSAICTCTLIAGENFRLLVDPSHSWTRQLFSCGVGIPMARPPLPPFTFESATQKVRLAEDAWNTRDPQRVAAAYTLDSRWRNRAEFFTGRDAIVAFLQRKWAKELDYRLIKELWAFHENRIAVRFQYEYHDGSGNWFRAYGNERVRAAFVGGISSGFFA